MQSNDVASTSFCRHVPSSFFFINQCQIITFLILKSDIIENSRIELRGIVLPAPSKQIKVTFIPSTWYICDFFLFHIEIEGGGETKGMLAPLKLLGGGGGSLPPHPPPPPSASSNAYEHIRCKIVYSAENIRHNQRQNKQFEIRKQIVTVLSGIVIRLL